MLLQNSNNPHFNSLEILQDYLSKNYDVLSEKLIQVLEHFELVTYTKLTPESGYFINAFIKNFLYIFTQPDYLLGDRFVSRFIQLNLTISNLVAISDFKTTDPYLNLLKLQPQNYAKILTLCSARNKFQFERKDFFDASPDLASLWYSHYLEIYRTGLVNRIVYQNLREHLSYDDDHLTGFYKIDDLYFGATYIDGEQDRLLKAKINRSIQNSQFVKNITIFNHPNPHKIAVISGFWFPQHSIYRILSECIAALSESYELTLIHVGDRELEIDTRYFQHVKYLQFQNDSFDLSFMQENDFAAVFYPDIGMLPASILLSNIRLAPIQICGLGHPVSTFGSEIDYFISGLDGEISSHAEANYSERLVLLAGSGAVNNRPDYQPRKTKQNAALTLSKSKITGDKSQFIINCPWYAQKVNYPLLVLLKKIAQEARFPVLFRFFSGGALTRKNDFLPFAEDVAQFLGSDRVCVYPYMPYAEYMAIMEEGYMCLDSYHFGGFNVVVDGLYLQKPSVVFEGKRWYSRVGARLMKKLGLGDLVAKTSTEYIQLTLKLINNPDFLLEIQERVSHIDLEKVAFQSKNGQYFKKAIDFLIQNHEHIQKDTSKKPIRISCNS